MKKQDAEQIALKYIESNLENPEIRVQILDQHTVQKPYGYLFFDQSKKYVDTNSIEAALVGNGPVLVLQTGNVVQFPSAIPLDEAIKRYEAGEPLLPGPMGSES